MHFKTEVVLYLSCFLPLKMHSSEPFSGLPLISVTLDKLFRPNLLTSVAHSMCINFFHKTDTDLVEVNTQIYI